MKTSWHIFWPILEQCDLSTASPPPPRASIKCAANFKDLIRPGHNSIFMYLVFKNHTDRRWWRREIFSMEFSFLGCYLLAHNRFSRFAQWWRVASASREKQSRQIKRYNLRWCLMITIFFYFIHLGVTSLMNGIRDTISEIQHGNDANELSKLQKWSLWQYKERSWFQFWFN